MIKYISVPDNLKLMMNLLRDKSKNIQFEAFHVFKVQSGIILQIFVANPNKAPPISDILNKNKEKLLQFLSSFHNDRTDDEQFNDEKSALMKQIKELQPWASIRPRFFKMSWQTYVDSNLVGTGKLNQAAIHGHNGGLWATSAGFSVKFLD